MGGRTSRPIPPFYPFYWPIPLSVCRGGAVLWHWRSLVLGVDIGIINSTVILQSCNPASKREIKEAEMSSLSQFTPFLPILASLFKSSGTSLCQLLIISGDQKLSFTAWSLCSLPSDTFVKCVGVRAHPFAAAHIWCMGSKRLRKHLMIFLMIYFKWYSLAYRWEHMACCCHMFVGRTTSKQRGVSPVAIKAKHCCLCVNRWEIRLGRHARWKARISQSKMGSHGYSKQDGKLSSSSKMGIHEHSKQVGILFLFLQH